MSAFRDCACNYSKLRHFLGAFLSGFPFLEQGIFPYCYSNREQRAQRAGASPSGREWGHERTKISFSKAFRTDAAMRNLNMSRATAPDR
jgi:hypothetical protein